jgi:hypothetical protein
MNKAVFLVGGPGSGKDILLKNTLHKFNLVEFKLEQIIPILEGSKSYNLNNSSIVISTNAYDFDSIEYTKKLFENNNYKTCMIFVDVNESTSKERLSNRQNITESVRVKKLKESKSNIKKFYNLFDNFIIYENNYSDVNSSRLIDVNIFCEFFINFEYNLFEAEELSTKLIKRYSPKGKMKKNMADSQGKLSPMTADNISYQDYPVRDPGFPTPTGGIGDITRSEGVEYEPNYSSFSSFSRSTVPTEIYPTPNQIKTINTIKKIAKNSWRKKK